MVMAEFAPGLAGAALTSNVSDSPRQLGRQLGERPEGEVGGRASARRRREAGIPRRS